MKLKVKGCGKEFVINIDDNKTVYHLKCVLSLNFNIGLITDKMELLYNGNYLKNSERLIDCNITKSGVIAVLIQTKRKVVKDAQESEIAVKKEKIEDAQESAALIKKEIGEDTQDSAISIKQEKIEDAQESADLLGVSKLKEVPERNNINYSVECDLAINEELVEQIATLSYLEKGAHEALVANCSDGDRVIEGLTMLASHDSSQFSESSSFSNVCDYPEVEPLLDCFLSDPALINECIRNFFICNSNFSELINLNPDQVLYDLLDEQNHSDVENSTDENSTADS